MTTETDPTGHVFQTLVNRYPALEAMLPDIRRAQELLTGAFSSGGKVLVCGNGGSSADAGHIVGELMKGMTIRRRLDDPAGSGLRLPGTRWDGRLLDCLEPALPAIDLCSQHALITAIANDTDPDLIFAQQIFGYGRPGDVLWALSTSGRSANVLLAAATARGMGLGVLALTGPADSELSQLADVAIKVPGPDTQTVQEHHLPIYHALCAALEIRLLQQGLTN